MKKFITLLIAGALMSQSVCGALAVTEADDGQTPTVGEAVSENITEIENEEEGIASENSEEEKEETESEEAAEIKTDEEEVTDTAAEENEEIAESAEKAENAEENDKENDNIGEHTNKEETLLSVQSISLNSTFERGEGSYTFDSEGELADWTNPDGKISWDSTVDATDNGGGSVKFEYDTKTAPSLYRIKISIPLEELYSDIAYGECYTVTCKVKGERVKSGAKAYMNISSQLNTDQYYPIALPKSGGVAITNEWETVSLTFIYNSVLENLEILFPDGLSKQNDSANYDIYYIDDVKLEKHDTMNPYAEQKGWLKQYSADKTLKVKERAMDLSETASLMQVGEQQQIVVYDISGAELNEPVGNIKRERSTLEGYSFKSSVSEVAAVDDNGVITAKESGYTVITATKGTASTQFILTVIDDKNDKNNFILDKTSNYFGRVEDFTGMRDYIYMSFVSGNGYSYASNKTAMNVTTPHIASFRVYDPGTSAVDMTVYYGNGSKNLFYGGTSNRWYDNSYRWIRPDNGFDSSSRTAGWHQVYLVIDYPTTNSAADGYMSCTLYFDGSRVMSYEFNGNSWQNPMEFYIQANGVVKEAYVVKCGNDFTIENMTPQSRTDISVNQSFEFEFSNPIDVSTVDGNVLLSDGEQEIPAKITADGKKLTIIPEYPLEKGEKYTVTLKEKLSAIPKVTGITGNMGGDRSFIFTTEGYPISYEVKRTALAKLQTAVTNASSVAKDVYYVGAFYKNNACESLSFMSDSIGADSTKTVVLTTGTGGGKVAEYDGYEIFVYERNADGGMGRLLNKPVLYSGAREIKATDITPKNETRITVGYDSENEIVEITGYSITKRSGLPIDVRIRKKGDDNTVDSLVRAETVKTGKNGEVNYSFKLKDGTEKGRYTVEIKMPFEDSIYEREFNYIDLSEAREYLKAVDKATTVSEVAATDIFNPDKDPFCIIDSDFTELKDKNLLFGAILENKTYADRSSNVVAYFKDIYMNALDISKYVWGDTDSCINEIKENHLNEYWNIKENNAYKTFFEKFADTQQKKVIDKLKNAKCLGDLSKIFCLEVMREDIAGQSSYSTVCPTLKKYNDIHNIDYSIFSSLSETKQLAVAEKFQKAIGSIDSIKAMKDTFEAYAKSEKGSSDGGKESGGGSGKGGSGSSGVAYIPGTPVGNPEISNNVPDWYEDTKNTGASKIFDDIDSVAWAEESINKLYKLGAISGKAEKLFDPNSSITREELCKIVAAAFKLEKNDEAGKISFSDVADGQWYTDYIELCYQNGVINGIGDNTFGVGRTVTREEIATILVRAAEAVGKSLDYYFTIFPFADENEISDWAKKNVSILRECMIINGVGDGRFAPKDNVTRAQAAKMIAGILDFNY